MLLSPPYGVCGSQPLAYYDSYSRSRCEMECQTNNLIDNCGCIDVYMPGSVHSKRPAVFTTSFDNDQKW
jgi:hypothetical protein